MITYSEVQGAEPHTQFFAYAHAYRDAAEALCELMLSERARETWPNASVVLMLSAHSVELFLKAAILLRAPTARLDHHNITALTEKYHELYLEPELSWEVPFQVTRLGSSVEESLSFFNGVPPHSVLFRYPTGKDGVEWKGAFGFEPRAVLLNLQGLRRQFQTIQSRLNND